MSEEIKVNSNEEIIQDTEKQIEEDLANKKIPYDRFKKVNDAYKELSDKLNQLQKEKEEGLKKQLEEQNRYKELYENVNKEVESYKSKATQYDSFVNSELEKEMKSLSEDDMKFVNEFIEETSDPAVKLKKIKALKTRLTDDKKPLSDTDLGDEGDKKLKPGKNMSLVDPLEILRKASDPTRSQSERLQILRDYEKALSENKK